VPVERSCNGHDLTRLLAEDYRSRSIGAGDVVGAELSVVLGIVLGIVLQRFLGGVAVVVSPEIYLP
jgi:hypothetical protein